MSAPAPDYAKAAMWLEVEAKCAPPSQGFHILLSQEKADELAEMLRHAAQEREALERLVAKIEEVQADKRFIAPFQLAAIHGGDYNGPTWIEELKQAQAALVLPLKGGR